MLWVECYAGPADGERVPIDPDDPMPNFPYLMQNEELHWYQLWHDGGTRYRYVLLDAVLDGPWEVLKPITDLD